MHEYSRKVIHNSYIGHLEQYLPLMNLFEKSQSFVVVMSCTGGTRDNCTGTVLS